MKNKTVSAFFGRYLALAWIGVLKRDCLNNECLPVIDDDLILKPTGMTINSIITTNKR